MTLEMSETLAPCNCAANHELAIDAVGLVAVGSARNKSHAISSRSWFGSLPQIEQSVVQLAVAGQRPISAPDYASSLRNLLLHLLKECRQVYERLTSRC